MATTDTATGLLPDTAQAPEERRRFRRLRYVSPAKIAHGNAFTADEWTGSPQAPIQVYDISCGGVGFHASTPVPVGGTVALQLANNWMLPPSTLRITRCSRMENGSYEAGAVFQPVAA